MWFGSPSSVNQAIMPILPGPKSAVLGRVAQPGLAMIAGTVALLWILTAPIKRSPAQMQRNRRIVSTQQL